MYLLILFSVPLLAPDNLILESVGVSWIVLTWRDSSIDIVRYIVLVRGAGQEANITVEGKNIANVTGLLPGTDYQLRVTAVSSDGRMSQSSDVLETTTLFAGELYKLSMVLLFINPRHACAQRGLL